MSTTGWGDGPTVTSPPPTEPTELAVLRALVRRYRSSHDRLEARHYMREFITCRCHLCDGAQALDLTPVSFLLPLPGEPDHCEEYER